jgi:hypothetical protein
MRATEGLHICGSCRRPFVVHDAIQRAPAGIEQVVVDLRCVDCGWLHTGTYAMSAVEALDLAMDLDEREIRAALEVIEFADQVERIDRFARALELGLITPGDFV